MSNEYFDHTTYPAPNAPGSSAALRAEFDKVEVGFDKLPTLSGNASKPIAVKADQSGLEAVGSISANLTGNVTASTGTSTFNNVTISGTLNMDVGTSGGITGLPTPTNDTDAASKSYVDSVAQGLDIKPSVRVATTANITLSGTQTIDGVSVGVGDRVLVKDQSTASQNGIYVVASGGWTRAADADAWTDLPGAFTFVEEGTANDNSGWVCTVAAGGTLGSTSVTFEQFSGAGQVIAGAGMTKSGNTLDVGTASSSRIVVNANNIDLALTGVSAGTYNNVTVDAYGRVTSATNDSFGDLYLGSKSSDPTVDNQGDPLVVGAMYFNTTSNKMRVYTALSVWTDAGSAVNGTSARSVYVATAGQTTFNINYDVGFVDVYLNGSKLTVNTEFIATNGTTVVLTSGATAGDVIDMVAYGSFSVANTYTQAQADTLLAAKASLTGTETLTNKTLTGLKETRVAMAASDIDLAAGNVFTKTISTTTTFTVSNVPTTGTVASFVLDLTNGGSATINWWSGVKWIGGTAPGLTAAGRDVIGFFTHDGGTTWTGLVAGRDVK